MFLDEFNIAGEIIGNMFTAQSTWKSVAQGQNDSDNNLP